MEQSLHHDIVKVLLGGTPHSLAQVLNIPVEEGSREALFRLLSSSLLFNVMLSEEMSVRASLKLAERGWVSPETMVKSTLPERITALEEADYIIFDTHENAARRLGEMAETVIRRYGGDLANLRRQADRMPERERTFVKEFGGMGEMQTDLFLREVQVAWPELFPFVTKKALNGARKLGLSEDILLIAGIAGNYQLPRLNAALERVNLMNNQEEILAKARQRSGEKAQYV